jgi:hypothetical protein
MLLPNGLTLHDQIVYKILEDKTMKLFLIHWNTNFIPLVSGHMRAGDFITPAIAAASFSTNRRYSFYLLLEKYLYLLHTQDSFTITKDEIRERLQIQPTEYIEFKMLNAKVIKPALKDIYDKLGIPLVVKVKNTRVMFSYGDIK